MLRLLCTMSFCGLITAQDPAPTARQTAAEETGAARREIYKRVGDVSLSLEILAPEGHAADDARPALVFFFGGGWKSGTPEQFRPQAKYLAARGMVAVLADYRVSSRHGTTPFECVADGKSAIRWLRTHADRLGIDPARIGAGGGSAGGHVAAAAGVVPGLDEAAEDGAISSKPDALVLFNPVFDNGPDGYGHDRVKPRWREISPLHNVAEGAPPTVVFLGTKDRLVPVAAAEAYVEAMERVGSRCELHLYDGQPHGFFNRGRTKRCYQQTVFEMDRFLASLGWLEGPPTIAVPAAEPAEKGGGDGGDGNG